MHDPAPSPQHLSLTRTAEGGETVRLVLAGEFDLCGRAHLAGALDDAQGDVERVVLDLRALAFIDASCLAVIYAAARRARNEHGSLVLVEPRAQVRRLLDLAGAPDGVAVLDESDRVVPRRAGAAA